MLSIDFVFSLALITDADSGNGEDSSKIDLFTGKLIKGTTEHLFAQLLRKGDLVNAVQTDLSNIKSK